MQFVSDILIGIISGYLAFTNTLADGIISLLPVEEQQRVETTQVTPALEIVEKITSTYSGGIPDILVQNAAYQQAAAVSATAHKPVPTTNVKDALVNIYCTYKTDSKIRTSTGTGFFVSPNGVVMTNAHVAQFLLLETVNNTGTTACVLRAGDPAAPLYEAELLYISPAWIQQHAHLITSEHPRGTGERDYALLYVTAGVDNKPMPAHFPYLSLNTNLLSKEIINDTIIVAGYPAATALSNDPNAELRPQAASTTLTNLYTFASNQADVMAIGESIVGEFGASGGPVLNDRGEVIGLISTKGSNTDGARSLRGLSLAYINRTIVEESTFDLERTMSGALELRAKLFTETIATFLSKVLEAELE